MFLDVSSPRLSDPRIRSPQAELVNLQSHLKRLQDLQAQLEQQLGVPGLSMIGNGSRGHMPSPQV